jgi:hypothetical protein
LNGAGNKWRYERVYAVTKLPLAGILPWLSRPTDDFDADPETKRVLHAALEMTRAALGLADDFANGIIARQIVELCQGRLAASRRFVRRRIEEITRAFVRGLTGAP